MKNIAMISGLVEFGLAFVLGIVVAFGAFRLFARIHRDIDETSSLANNNVAVGVLQACLLIGTAIIVREGLTPVTSSLQTLLVDSVSWGSVGRFIIMSLGYLVLVLALALIAVSSALRIFIKLNSSLDEMSHIKQNNVSVAITFGAVIIVMSLFLAQGAESLLAALVPYPSIENIRVMGG